MRQGHWAPLVGPPSCLRREVSRNDLFVQVRRHRAWTRIDVYGAANNGGDEAARKARCGSVFETRAARIDQHDAAVTPASRAFNKLTERFEYSRHRLAARHHFEQALFTDEQSVNPLPVVDISVQEVPKDDTPFRISQGESAHVEPAVDPVSTAATAFNVARKAGFDRPPPRGEDTCAVIRMKVVAPRPPFQLLERRAEILQVAPVGEFEVTGRCPESDEGRKAVDDQTKTTFARSQSFLSPPSVLDVDTHSAPFDDLSGCVS